MVRLQFVTLCVVLGSSLHGCTPVFLVICVADIVIASCGSWFADRIKDVCFLCCSDIYTLRTRCFLFNGIPRYQSLTYFKSTFFSFFSPTHRKQGAVSPAGLLIIFIVQVTSKGLSGSQTKCWVCKLPVSQRIAQPSENHNLCIKLIDHHGGRPKWAIKMTQSFNWLHVGSYVHLCPIPYKCIGKLCK